MRLSDPIEKPGVLLASRRSRAAIPRKSPCFRSRRSHAENRSPPHGGRPPRAPQHDPFGEHPPRILGIWDNNAVTLQKCAAVEDPFYWLRIMEGYVAVSRFNIGAAFIGAPFPDDTPISFTRVDCSFESLGEWFSISGFRPEIKSDSEPADWSLHYAQPDNIP